MIRRVAEASGPTAQVGLRDFAGVTHRRAVAARSARYGGSAGLGEHADSVGSGVSVGSAVGQVVPVRFSGEFLCGISVRFLPPPADCGQGSDPGWRHLAGRGAGCQGAAGASNSIHYTVSLVGHPMT